MSNQLYILNADNSINWERYKEYTEHYNNQHCPLSEPYNEEELRQICVEKQIELPEALFNYLTKVSNIIYIEEGYLSSTVFDVSNYEDFEKKHKSIEDYIIKNFDRRYNPDKHKGARGAEALANDLEDEGNYPVDSVTEKHNEDTRKMTIEVIDKVFAEYLEKNKDSIYIYYPKKEDWDWNWKPLSNDDDW